MFVTVKDSSFVRDINSMGLSNTDIKSREEYFTKVKESRTHRDNLNKLTAELDGLRSELKELKILISNITK